MPSGKGGSKTMKVGDLRLYPNGWRCRALRVLLLLLLIAWLMIHNDKLWRTIGEVLFLKNTFRQALNRIHFSETHTEREFGHMLHIENKKRHLFDDLLEGMVRVLLNDP